MQQLITIETVPISIRYVEKAPEPKKDEGGTKALKPEKNGHMIKPDKGQSRRDSFVQNHTVDAYNLTYTATARYSDNSVLRMIAKMNETEDDPVIFQQFSKGIQNMIHQFLEQRPEPAFESQSMQLDFDFSSIGDSAPGSGNSGYVFTPPSFELEILERPKVVIKYVGGPIYIPKSADPNYEAPDKIDAKA